VGPVGQPVAQSEGFEAGSEDLEAESDDFEEVFSMETEGVDLCEAVQRLLPANIIVRKPWIASSGLLCFTHATRSASLTHGW
jgi:hypothetical protein